MGLVSGERSRGRGRVKVGVRVGVSEWGSAPMASNITLKPQSSASPAPQKTTSALPSWICSMPTPMQCAPG